MEDQNNLPGEAAVEIKNNPQLYKRRFYILILFCCYSATSAFQWIHLSIISTTIVEYYGVRISVVDWLSIVFMLVYIPVIFPVSWLLNRYGLRVIAVIGSSLNALGALVKLGSCQPHLFPVLMTGSTIAAFGQVFIYGMPPKVAAVWFGESEVSTACAVGVFGFQIGVALGFLIPPNFVPDTDDKVIIEQGLNILTISTAAITTFLAILVWCTFQKQPEKPPSAAQAKVLMKVADDAPESFTDSLKKLIFDRSAVLLIISYGMNTGSFYALGTLLNDQILDSYPERQTEAGQIGLVIIFCGIAGSILCGFILDKTHAYRKTAVVVYGLTLASYILYTVTLGNVDIWVVYLTGGAVGFTMTGYLPVGLEFAAEITYPVCEGTSSGILNAAAETSGIVLTLLMRHLITNYSVVVSNIAMIVFLVVGALLTNLVKENLKRQRANKPTEEDRANKLAAEDKETYTNRGFQPECSSKYNYPLPVDKEHKA